MTLFVAVVAASTSASLSIERGLRADRAIDIIASSTLANFSLPRLRRADILVLDYELPFDIVRQLIRAVGGPASGPGVIVVGAPPNREILIQYFEHGMRGYVLDFEPRAKLLDVVSEVHGGGVRMDSWLAGSVIEQYRLLLAQVTRITRRNGNGRAPEGGPQADYRSYDR